jgi:hypothetical protein
MLAPLPRVKFIWGASRVIQGRWYLGLFGFYDRVEGVRDDGLAISVRGLLAWGAVLAVAAYVALASALFFVWRRSPYNRLGYTDALFYPARRASIAEQKGRAFIAEGMDLWQAKKYREAANLLRQGLARVPHDLPARTTLAQYHLLAGNQPQALRVLQDGLGDEYPGRTYVQTLCEVADQGENFDVEAEACARYRGKLPAAVADVEERWLEAREFAALLAAGRASDALAAAEAAGDGDVAREQRVVALLALGRIGDAVAFLAAWHAQPDASRSVIARLQVRAFREAKRFSEMDAAIEEFRQLAPADPAPLVYAVVQQAMAGRAEAARAALDDYLFRFGGTASNLLLVAEPLAEIGDRALLERCAAAAKERGYPAERYQVLWVQTCVQRGEWADAARELAQMPRASARSANAGATWREWAERLVGAASTSQEAAQLALVELLRSRPWSIPVFRRSILALRQAGRTETARDVAGIAAAAFPASAWLKTEAAEIAAELRTRAAPSEAGNAPDRSPKSEAEFFAGLDAALRAAQWTEADNFIRELRRIDPPPAWRERREPDLRFAQMRIAAARGSRNELLAAARVFLSGDPARANQALTLAQEIYRGDRETAIALVDEVLRTSPHFAAAEKLLDEWQPASAPAK